MRTWLPHPCIQYINNNATCIENAAVLSSICRESMNESPFTFTSVIKYLFSVGKKVWHSWYKLTNQLNCLTNYFLCLHLRGRNKSMNNPIQQTFNGGRYNLERLQIINNNCYYWTRFSKISWFVSGKHIDYFPKQKAEAKLVCKTLTNCIFCNNQGQY